MEIIKAYKTIDGKLFEYPAEALVHQNSEKLHNLMMEHELGLVFVEFTKEYLNTISMNELQQGIVLFGNYDTFARVGISKQAFYSKLRLLCKLKKWTYVSRGTGVNRRIRFVGFKLSSVKQASYKCDCTGGARGREVDEGGNRFCNRCGKFA